MKEETEMKFVAEGGGAWVLVAQVVAARWSRLPDVTGL